MSARLTLEIFFRKPSPSVVVEIQQHRGDADRPQIQPRRDHINNAREGWVINDPVAEQIDERVMDDVQRIDSSPVKRQNAPKRPFTSPRRRPSSGSAGRRRSRIPLRTGRVASKTVRRTRRPEAQTTADKAAARAASASADRPAARRGTDRPGGSAQPNTFLTTPAIAEKVETQRDQEPGPRR